MKRISDSVPTCSRRRTAVPAAWLLLLHGSLWGCGAAPDAGAARSAAAARLNLQIDQSTPEAAVRTLFRLTKIDIDAAARQDRAAQKVIFDALTQLASREDIQRRVKNIARLSGKPAEEFFDKVVGRWTAVLAEYYERAELSAMQVTATRADGQRVSLRVPSSDPTGRPAIVLLDCVNDKGVWRIASINFEGPMAASRPASSSAP